MFRIRDRVRSLASAISFLAWLVISAFIVGALVQPTDIGWIQAIVYVFLGSLFLTLGLVNYFDAVGSVVVTDRSIARTGPRPWELPRDQVASVRWEGSNHDRLVLRMTPEADMPKAVRQAIVFSRWFSAGKSDARSIVLSIDPHDAPSMQQVLPPTAD